MDYLALCKRARMEFGIAGDGPAAVTGQSGQLEKVVTYVSQAWQDIQTFRTNWDFMWKQFEFDTVVATRDYSAAAAGISDLEYWDTSSFMIYEKALGESDQNELEYMPYSKWRADYARRLNERSDDRPILITQLPDQQIRFEPRPDKIYTINGDYKRDLQELTANGDTPEDLPDRFHIMIVYKAMEHWGLHEDAPEISQRAEEQLNFWWPLLEDYALPEVTIQAEPVGGEGLATSRPGNFIFR